MLSLKPACLVCYSEQYIIADKFITNKNTGIMVVCVMYPPRDLEWFLSFSIFVSCLFFTTQL